jgi:hypothetical protein
MRIPSFVCKLLAVLGGIGILEGVAMLAINGTNGISAAEAAGVLGFVLPLYATGLFAYWKRPDLPVARLLLAVGAMWMVTQGTQGLLEGIYQQEGRISELWPVAMLGRFGDTSAPTSAD